jgi:uncharacterized protein
MPCARTLDPVPMTLQPQIYLLLAPRTAAPSSKVAHAKPGKLAGAKARAEPGRKARSKTREPEGGEALSEDDAARDTFEGDQIVLDGFIREHIVLELPLFPLRSDLRSEDSPAIRPPAAAPVAARAVDPRLLPLADIAKKMRESKE